MNTIFFKIWIFEINFTTILSFLIGVVVGFVLLCMLYALFVLASLRDKKFLVKTKDDSLTTTEVKDMIITAQKTFKDKNLRGKKKRIPFAYEIGKDLVYGIATRFYPKSKYPLLELSVDESIMLTVYIKERLEAILNRRGIRLLKGFKIASIVNLTQTSNKVANSEAFKVTKEVSSVAKKIMNVVNIINPVVLVRKYIIGSTLNMVTDKLCVVALAVVGEETYKIYSKSVFNEEVDIDSNVDSLLSDIDEEFKKVSSEAKKSIEDVIKPEKEDEIPAPTKAETRLMGKAYNSTYNENIKINPDSAMPMMSIKVSEEDYNEKEETI